MYTRKVVAFVDVLGFSSLVEKSQDNLDTAHIIHDIVTYMMPEKMAMRSCGQINHEAIPADKLQDVKRDMEAFSQALLTAHPISFSSFSDCLVISCDCNDVVAMQLILDSMIKMNVYFWEEHSILVRGGVVVGDMFHLNHGPVFGPAMNAAYYLESEVAVNPRIVISAEALCNYRRFDTFQLLEPAVANDGDYESISLHGSYKYLYLTSYQHSDAVGAYDANNKVQLSRIKTILESCHIPSVRNKYVWLESKFSNTSGISNYIS